MNSSGPGLFRVRRVSAGVLLHPEAPRFHTCMLAMEHAESLDLGAEDEIQVLEGDEVLWTRAK